MSANHFHPNMGETARRWPTGIRPYGRSSQRPGVTPDHWPVPRRRTRMSWRVPGWAKYGAAARSLVYRRENLKVVSFAANSRATMAIWGAGVGALSRPPLAGPAGKSFTIILAIFRNSCRWRLPAGGRPARGRVRPAAVIRAGAGVQER